MSLYLAYGIGEEDLSWSQLEKIMTDWFDFPTKGIVHDFSSWLESAKLQLDWFKQGDVPEIVKKRFEDDRNPLRLATSYDTCQYVKGWPLLEISFKYKDTCPHCPANFSGLNIWAGHSGSCCIVDLFRIKPQMDAYLVSNGVKHVDLSFLEL